MSQVIYVAEPSGRWLSRPRAVIDCSMLAAFLWDEIHAARAVEAMAGFELHAPTLLSYEIANVARNKSRSGVEPETVRRGLTDWQQQRIALHDIDPSRLYELAQRYALTAYDAGYLCLAEELRSPLLTLDQRLADAAARHLNPGN
jgi:predicted nucleic acid-binding protein